MQTEMDDAWRTFGDVSDVVDVGDLRAALNDIAD